MLADGQTLRSAGRTAAWTTARRSPSGCDPNIQLDEDGAAPAEVEVVEPLGMSTQFYVQLAGQQVCVFVMGRSNVRPGDLVRLSADPAALHLFDPASGNRIG